MKRISVLIITCLLAVLSFGQKKEKIALNLDFEIIENTYTPTIYDNSLSWLQNKLTQ